MMLLMEDEQFQINGELVRLLLKKYEERENECDEYRMFYYFMFRRQ